MAEHPILVLDSGIGGLPYVSAVRSLMPAARFSYVADHAGFPYGERDPADLRYRLLQLTERLIEREHPALVLLACNTASVVALDALRERFALPFVGVVPAVKPAASHSRTRRIGVLATARTVEERYLHDLVQQFAGECAVVTQAAGEIVRLVEQSHGELSPQAVRRCVGKAVGCLVEAGVDTVVLGCTHFIYLLEELQQLFGPGVTVIDSREGVARQVQRVAGTHCSAGRGGLAEGADRFYTTGSSSAALQSLAAQFGFDKVLEL